MPNLLLQLLTIGLLVLIVIHVYNKVTLRENFHGRTREAYGKMRKLKRNTTKFGEEFIGSIVYKLKSTIRKARL